ncbi:hypothetical protein GGF38_002066, partial [Coemansia sp. RSA 25]
DSEEGALESDKSDKSEQHSASPTHTGEKSSGGGDTDAEGNPIVTNENASYWNMITPTGVSYLSGGWRVAPGAAALGVAVVVAMGALV